MYLNFVFIFLYSISCCFSIGFVFLYIVVFDVVVLFACFCLLLLLFVCCQHAVLDWESRLVVMLGTVEYWVMCQKTWLYLENIFTTTELHRSGQRHACMWNNLSLMQTYIHCIY